MRRLLMNRTGKSLPSIQSRLWTLAIAMALCACSLPAAAAAVHSAPTGVIVDGHARFTVITPTLIRLEFSSDGHFIQRRSYFAWERHVKPPQYKVTRANGVLTIATSRLRLTWKGGNKGFSPTNLSISFRNGETSWQSWHPGEKQTGNLGGTLVRLDGATGAQPLPDGVVSRDGWFLYRDDTFLVSDGPHPWMQPRPKTELHDWYFFGYGAGHYHTALADLTTVSGKIPIPPRYMLGSWRSRYYSYTQNEFQQLILNYNSHKFPLDVLVMDMGWHETPHWGSMDWNKNLIPDPTALLHWLHARHLHVTLNWHPQGGVGPWYSQYDAFCKAIGVDPAKKKVLPFDDTNQKFMRAYFKLLMNPLEKQGVDFWWLDDAGKYLAWDNALDFWNIERPGTNRRGASFSRWGGWGDQRYPVFFSGDTSSLWRVLRFEVPFTATAGNVGADYWSNDISGFRLRIPQPQLFTRWVQFGVLSPVFRTHGEIEFGNYRLPWAYGTQAETASRKAYNLRARLFPYIYSSAYLTSKTSLPLARPLYLDHPNSPQAYQHPEEYGFGPDILAAPIVTRGMGHAWLGATAMWFPRGTWWNLLTNESVGHPGNHTILATANEIPVFARGGIPLPMQPVKMRMATKPANPLVVRAYPGPSGSFTMYEDDGTSPAYLHGAHALTPLHYQNLAAHGVRVTVGPTKGSYTGQPTTRQIIVQLPATTHPAGVTVNGIKLPESSTAHAGYAYHPATATTTIRLPRQSIRRQAVVTVTFRGSQSVQTLIPTIINKLATVQRAIAGANQQHALWKLQLIALQFHLQTLLSKAEQEFGPASSQQIQDVLTDLQAEQTMVQSNLENYKNQQARAAAFALSNTYLSASVRMRKANEGLMSKDMPRYHRSYGRTSSVKGYNAGLLLRVLQPTSASSATLAVNVPGIANKHFQLPQGQQRTYAYLPFMKATQFPLYHLNGTATLTLGSGASTRILKRAIHLHHALLDQWSVAGPFAKDQSPSLGNQPITAATLHHTYTGKSGKSVSWITWRIFTSSHRYANGPNYLKMMKPWINISSLYRQNDASAVAVTWIEAPEAVTAKLSARHSAGLTVWLNQSEVMHSPTAVGVTNIQDPPPDQTTIHLHKGWNQIVVSTDANKKLWGFALRLKLPNGIICAQSDHPPVN